MEMTETMKILSNSKGQTKHREYSTFDLDLTLPKSLPPSLWLSRRFFVGIMLFSGYVLSEIACFRMDYLFLFNFKHKDMISQNTHEDNFRIFLGEAIMASYWMWHYGKWSKDDGLLIQTDGGSQVLGVSILKTGLFIVATSFNTYFLVFLFCSCRFFFCFSRVYLLPACFSAIFASWVPKKERCVFMACVISGIKVSGVIEGPFYRYLVQYVSWPMPLVPMGALSMTWAALWLTLVKNMPLSDPWISESELDYILEETGNPSPSQTEKFDKNSSDWVLSLGKFAIKWAERFIIVNLPAYIKDRTGESLFLDNRFQIGEIIFVVMIGALMTFWQHHTALTVTQIYKVVICGAFTITAVLIATIPITNNLFVWIFLIKLLLSCNMVFLEVVTVNMAPNHAALLSSFTLIWQNVGYALAYFFAKFFLPNLSLQELNVYFFLTAGITLVSGIGFLIFGSSDPQRGPNPFPR